MKVLKKSISIMLVVIMVVSVFSIVPFTANATETPESTPEYLLFQAKQYLTSFEQMCGSGLSNASVLYNSMKNDQSVISGVAIWETMHIATSLSYSLESGLITKKDMYKFAIFDMLDVSESDTFVSNLLDTLGDERASYIVSIAEEVCDSDDIDVSELKNFKITEEYLGFLENGAKVAKALAVVDELGVIVDGCDNLYEAINTMASYQAISNMKNGVEEMLNAIANDTSNPIELRQAALECAGSFSSGYLHILTSISDGSNPYVNATLETIFSALMDEAWDQLINLIPGGSVVMTSAQGTRLLLDSVFAMDDTCRMYYELETQVALENAVRRVMVNARDNFSKDSTQSNATAFLRAVDIYKRIVLRGYDCNIEMLTIKANAPFTQWTNWFNHDYSECMELIEGVETNKRNKQSIYKQFEELVLYQYTLWHCPDYNETMNGFNNQHPIYAKSLTLTQTKEININDTGYIYDYIQKVCQPENSIENKKSYFVSSNSEIFTINSVGYFTAHSSGEVTLTYDEGGELESSITITIGSTPTVNDPYDYYSDFKYSIWYNYDNDQYEVTITSYTGSKSNVIIPRTIEGYTVTLIGKRAFSGCSSLTSVTIPNSVTSIGDDVFYKCSSLTSVTIPSSVKSIGDDAFCNCSSLTSVTIPNSVTSIGDWVFYKCSSLTSVTIPNSVTSIGDCAFSGCSSLTSVTIPNSVTIIDGVFQGCSSLTSVTIPNSVTIIDSAFSSCSSLTSVTIPNSVTIIDGAFSGCSSLTSVTIPNSVTSIDGAFSRCSSLTSVTIPSSVTSTDSAFRDCSNLTSVTIQNGVTSIGNSAFLDCSSLTSVTIPSSVKSIENLAFSGCRSLTSVNIPSSVTSIGNSAFSSCSSLTSVTIPSSVTSIGNHAFSSCSSLTSVTIPSSVTSIENSAFYYCSSLTSVNIPSSVTSIGNSAFSFCSSLTSVTIPSSVTSIGNHAFSSCSSLTSVTIPSSVTSIGNSAFVCCSSLTSVTIPSSVTGIGNHAFSSCSSLTSVTILGSVTSIGDFMFYNCSSLTSVNIPSSVTSIGKRAFSGCSSLTSVTIPDSVTSIGDYVFYDCNSLTSVTIPDGVTNIGGYAFYNCSSLTSVTIPSSVTSIGDYAFYNCSSLTSVTIPSSVTSIGDYVFYGCSSLTSVTIPSSVTSIGSSAFYNCSSLTSVTIPGSVKSIGGYVFYGCSSLTSVTIPSGVTSIGYSAFEYCSSLTSVTIASSVTSIGSGAFRGCRNVWHVFYTGSEEQWNSIDISSVDNYYFTNATRHYNTEESLECMETVQPSCTKNGYNKYKCLICSDETTVSKYELGHNYENGICTRCGKVSHYTINVGDCAKAEIKMETGDIVYFKFIPEETTTYDFLAVSDYYIYGRLWDEDKIERLEFAGGYNLKISYECVKGEVYYFQVNFESDEKTGVIPVAVESGITKAVHNYTVVETVKPNCTSRGYTTYECVKCEKTYKEYVSSLGHTGNLVEVIPPTCTSHGYSEYLCSVCNQTYSSGYVSPLGHSSIVKKLVEPGCTSKGYTIYECKTCKEEYNSDYLDPIGHLFENNICSHCGIDKENCFESSHPYAQNSNESWTINRPGASSISITFSETTYTESYCDYINIYDGDNNLIGSYTGDSLASQCITVYDDTIIINLTSDYSVECYGFAVDKIECFYGGDVNSDNTIDVSDVVLLLKYIVSQKGLSEDQLEFADVNKDGKVSVLDAILMQRYILGITNDVATA